MASSQITLVDSHPDARESLIRVLELDGYRIRSFSDAWSAWSELQREPSDLVIVDLDLPGIDGLELGALLRQRHGADLPLLAISCARGETLVRDVRSAGFDEFLFKPYPPADLTDCLRRYLAKRPGVGDSTRRRAG